MRHPREIVPLLLTLPALLALGCDGVTVNRTTAPETKAAPAAKAAALSPQMVELEKGVAVAKTRGPRSKGVRKPRRSEQIRKRGRDRIRNYKQNLRSIEQTRRDLAQPGAHRAATRRELRNLEEKNRRLREQIHQDYREWREALKEERGR